MGRVPSGADTIPHPLPRLVRTRRGSEIVPAEILHRTRAQWPGKIKTRNRILRAGTSVEGRRGIPRKRGTGGGATMGGDAHRSPPPAILWFLSHRWERNSPSRAKPCETARRVVAPYGCYGLRGMGGSGDPPLRRFRQIAAEPDSGRGKPLPYGMDGETFLGGEPAGGHMGPPPTAYPSGPPDNPGKHRKNQRF